MGQNINNYMTGQYILSC